jgi:HK97 family phage portal protein
MGLLERVQAEAAETRALEVPWRPWDSRYVPFNAGGPAHPSQTHTGMEQALRLAPLYAGARLLADMVASLPIQQYRRDPGGGHPTKVATGSLFTQPAAYGTIYDWLHMAMVSLVLTGNAWGFITQRDGYGFPTMIEWLPPERVSVLDDQEQPWNPMRSRIYFYGREMPRDSLFHIRAFSVPGHIEGLSPLRLFMELIQSGEDALAYGASWYKAGGFPPGTFQNQEIEVDAEQADEIRRRLTQSIRRREPLVYGRDWD